MTNDVFDPCKKLKCATFVAFSQRLDTKLKWSYNTNMDEANKEHKMNERIRELMKQATEEELDYTESGVPFVVREFVPEKFAELIVRECLDIVNRHEYSYHEADPLWETAQLIKEHFGVKE
jgi:hemerythrin superfamily protein